jgi:hypothetical protein
LEVVLVDADFDVEVEVGVEVICEREAGVAQVSFRREDTVSLTAEAQVSDVQVVENVSAAGHRQRPV